MIRFLIAILALVSFAPTAQAADWWEASTDHFVVYSDTSGQAAQDLAVKLERFDEAMRFMLGVAADTTATPRSGKLTVYQFGETADIGRLSGSAGVAGFFIPRAGQSVAFVPSRDDRRATPGTRNERGVLTPQIVLFHEYAHYFMFQHAAAAYPAWYREGFAEVYGTMELLPNGFRLGAPAAHRASVLQHLNAYHVRRLLDPPEQMTGEDGAQIYALGWMLSHYLTFSGQREGQLATYLREINQGATSLEAAQRAFGDLDALNNDLNTYRRGRTPLKEVTYSNYAAPTATVRKLGPDEQAMMAMHIVSTRGVDEAKARALVPDARALVQRFPQSVPVLLAATEAEFDAKNLDQAAALANSVLAIEANNPRAQLYLGRIALERAKTTPAAFAEARRAFAAANRADPANPDPLYHYYLTHVLAGETPPEPALVALETAYDHAPFDSSIRETLAHLLLTEGRDQEAITVLNPIINNPHAGKRAKEVRELVTKLKAGDRAPALAELAPKMPGAEDQEDDD